MIKSGIIISISFLMCMSIYAQQGSGHVSYHQIHSEISPGKDGMMIQRAMNRGTIVATNPADPFHLATQTCSGINIISKDGQPVESHGSCDAVDADGDIWWLTYSNKPNGNTWQIAGGTGKYKNMTGGGTTQPLTMNQETGMLTISYEGSWKMN